MHYPGIDGTTFHDGHPSTILNFDNDFKLPKHFCSLYLGNKFGVGTWSR